MHYFADTPDGAWAEFLRHEGITDPADLETVKRAMWAIEIPDSGYEKVDLPHSVLVGGTMTYQLCRAEAERIRSTGAIGLEAPSAALKPGGAAGWRVDSGMKPGPYRNGCVRVLFGPQPSLVCWRVAIGRPADDLLPLVHHF